MSKRSFFLIAALGLFASLAFGTPSQAGSVLASVGFSAYNTTPYADTITEVQFNFTGVSGITEPTFVGTAYASSPSLTQAVVTPAAAGETITLTFTPGSIFSISGTLSFIAYQTGTIALTSYSVAASADVQTHTGISISAVPEPASMGLLGIGMAGFFAFRRFFNKRNASV